MTELVYGGGISPVFIIAGQSNAEGAYLTAADLPSNLQTPDPKIKIWTGVTFDTLINGTNNGGPGEVWGPEAEFSRLFRLAYPASTIFLVKEAVSGTGLAETAGAGNDWSPSDLFATTTARVTAALAALPNPKVQAVLWMQGEQDTLAQDTADAYQTNLAAFETDMRSDWGDATTKLIVGRISDASMWTYRSTVRAAQAAVVAANPTLDALVDTDSYPLRPADGIHYTGAGQVLLGGDMFAAYRTLI